MNAAPDEDGEHDSIPDVDVTLIDWMLSLSPAERLLVLQDQIDSITELRHARVSGETD